MQSFRSAPINQFDPTSQHILRGRASTDCPAEFSYESITIATERQPEAPVSVVLRIELGGTDGALPDSSLGEQVLAQ